MATGLRKMNGASRFPAAAHFGAASRENRFARNPQRPRPMPMLYAETLEIPSPAPAAASVPFNAVKYTVTTAERAGSPADRYISQLLAHASARCGMQAIFVAQTVNGRRWQGGAGGAGTGAPPHHGEAYLWLPVTLADGTVYGTLWSDKPTGLGRQTEFLGALCDIAAAIAECAEHGAALALV